MELKLEDAVSLRRIALVACAALILSAAFAAPPDGKCPPPPGFMMFTPEQRLMMFADMQKQAETGAVDVQVLRQMQRDKMHAMTDEQRKAFADDLTKRWNALSPAEQAKLKADSDKWRAAHPRPEGAGPGPGPGGHHGDHPDCPPPPPAH